MIVPSAKPDDSHSDCDQSGKSDPDLKNRVLDQPGRSLVRWIAMVLFGLMVPVFIAFKADQRIQHAQEIVEQATAQSYIMDVLNSEDSTLLSGPSDYALVALADSERANLAVMVNKQIMKLVVIYMGFAVMSFAIMFVVLGFTEGPISIVGSNGGNSLEAKFETIGAAVFVTGAVMSAAGGLMKNEYQTVGLPNFAGEQVGNNGPDRHSEIRSFVEICLDLENQARAAECVDAGIADYVAE